MKTNSSKVIASVLFLAFFSVFTACKPDDPVAPSDLKGNLTGTVYEVDGITPVVGAIIAGESIDNDTTDANGNFSYNQLQAKEYTLTVNALGFLAKTADVRVVGNKTVEINIELTKGLKPNVSTNKVSEIDMTTAEAAGKVLTIGDAEVTAYGHCWSTISSPTIADNTTNFGANNIPDRPFTSELSNLEPGTQYYIRAYAENKYGIAYGSQVTFETLPGEPTVQTNSPLATKIEFNRVELTGEITHLGVNYVTQHGLVWSKNPSPTINDSKSELGIKVETGIFTSALESLEMQTTYYVRAYAINESGIAYGNQVSITTNDVFIDKRDAKTYKVVKIGNQIWMKENLKYVYPSSICKTGITGDCSVYGRFYNWTDALAAAPEGWHIPTETEWNEFIAYLGGENVTGAKTKYTVPAPSNSYWQAPPTGITVNTTNESGFSALGTGYLNEKTNLLDENKTTMFWFNAENGVNAKVIKLTHKSDAAEILEIPKNYFLPVRCILNSN